MKEILENSWTKLEEKFYNAIINLLLYPLDIPITPKGSLNVSKIDIVSNVLKLNIFFGIRILFYHFLILHLIYFHSKIFQWLFFLGAHPYY